MSASTRVIETPADSSTPQDVPAWTMAVHTARPPRAMYPLGIDPATQSLERRLFAGITSQTPHVVYYAFYAWALTRVRERLRDASRKTRLTKSEFRRIERRWVARAETVLRAATLEENPDVRGMFGARSAKADGPLRRSGRLALPDEGPYRTTGLNFYIGPLMDLGYADRQDGARGAFVATAGAKVLADAMESACRNIRGGSSALTRLYAAADGAMKSIDVADVRTLTGALAVQPVARTSPLHAPLVHLLFADEGPSAEAQTSLSRARSEALAVCLDVAHQANGEARGQPIAVMRRTILTGYLDRGRQYKVPDVYSGTVAALRRLYERHLLQLALYGFWREVVTALEPMPVTVRRLDQINELIASHVIENARVGEPARWLGRDPLSVTVGTLLDRVGRERRRRSRRRPWASGEERLALQVQATRNRTAPTAAASALALLLRVIEDWMHRTRDGRRVARSRWHARGGRDRLSLDIVCADMAQRTEMTGAQYLAWVLDTYIVGQSLKATIAKGPQSRTRDYVYFLVPDSGGYRLNQPPSLGSYLVLDSPRLTRALRLLHELDLIDDSPSFRLTAEGRRVRRRLLELHGSGDAIE